ncbi:MAG: glycosyltransferase [Acidobacteriota bacterium]
MRILQVTSYYEDAWAYGGIPRVAGATARALAYRGHDVTVCTTDACSADSRLASRTAPPPTGAPTPHLQAIHASAVDVRVFSNLSNRLAYHLQFFTPRGMNRYLEAHAGDFDIAHLHGCHHLPGAFASRHLRRAGVPYVQTTHGTAPYIERRRVAKRVFDLTVGRGVLQGAARVIAVSDSERDQLLEFGVPADAIRVIPNPIELHHFGRTVPNEFRRRVGLDRQTPLVMYLGKFTPRKRLDVLVKAFAALDRPDARLVIAGNDMGYANTLQAHLAEFGVADRTLLPGLLVGHDRLAALADADVVAYPSEQEVFGLVPVEALLCGTPVIVANDSGCGYVVGQAGGGLLVDPGSVDQLRVALSRVLDDRHTWRQRAQDAAVNIRQYDSHRIAGVLEDLYRELVVEPAPILAQVAG